MDVVLFRWINQGSRNPFFDQVMPFITEFDHFRFPLLGLWLILFFWGRRDTKVTLLLLAALIGILDYSNSFFFKHLFARPRPCQVLADAHVFWPCPRSFSFPSNHAANIFGAAFFLSFLYRSWSPLFLFLAVLVGYSRVYVGEHYPVDVLGGALLGALGAGLMLLLRWQVLSGWENRQASGTGKDGTSF
ncbi:MAG: phosphatase PAP2 family protein [Deltaproteobacteria bacterium]|nr:phosphatase PAP2 family protein [Deltaproteobacteria bacterium]